MGEAMPASNQRQPIKDWMTIVQFDGRGGVRKLEEAEEASFTTPAKGFALISGNSRAPEFKVWLKRELGDFNADLITVPSTRSRCTVLDDRALVVLRVARPGADPEDVGRQLLTLWIEKGRVIIASELNIVEFLGITQWQQTHHAPVSPADLVARLALRAADRIEPLIERMGDNLDTIEETLMLNRAGDSRSRLAHLRRTLINMRRLIWPQRDVLTTLEIEDLSFFTARDRVRLREAAARTARLGDEMQTLSERAVLVHEQLLDTRAEQMNQTMLLLAAATVVLMPLTVISGILGMNVEGIPFHNSPYAFWIVTGFLGVLGVAIYLFMRKKKWM
ncbi:MAG TPA: CorA family divalent cation transporter [Devosia sp.]|jgi:zinc transporter|uniref:CorA family divalent cation transporter n=1 Tax=Devosia sp. TaxID=1871048 RepID=UPI002DDD513E|nr:CorA family divalent cation transporter [Devosia sp.]HEV2514870.1 CorA family divalent cation transporter [Devosia sp.]